MISSVLCVLTEHIEIFIAARCLTGLSAAAMLVVARSAAADHYHGSALTKFFSVMMMIQGLAPVLAPILGGYLVAFFPWQHLFTILGLFSALLFAAVLLTFQESLPPEKRLSFQGKKLLQGFSALLKNPSFFSHCLLQFFVFSSLFAYISGAPFIFQVQYGFTSQSFGLLFGAVGCCMAGSGYITTLLAGKVNEKTILKWELLRGFSGALLFLIAVLLKMPVYLLILLLIATQTTLPNIASTSFSLALKNCPYIGIASALIGFFNTICGSIVSPIVGLGNKPDFTLACVLLVCESLAGLTYWLGIRQMK